MAQLVERLLLTPEIRSSNFDIVKILSTDCAIEKTKTKKKIDQEWPIFKKDYFRYTAKLLFSYWRARIIFSKLTMDLLSILLWLNHQSSTPTTEQASLGRSHRPGHFRSRIERRLTWQKVLGRRTSRWTWEPGRPWSRTGSGWRRTRRTCRSWRCFLLTERKTLFNGGLNVGPML